MQSHTTLSQVKFSPVFINIKFCLFFHLVDGYVSQHKLQVVLQQEINSVLIQQRLISF